MRIFAGLVSAGAVALMGAAWAVPPGISEKDGAFVAPDGKRSTPMRGTSPPANRYAMARAPRRGRRLRLRLTPCRTPTGPS